MATPLRAPFVLIRDRLTLLEKQEDDLPDPSGLQLEQQLQTPDAGNTNANFPDIASLPRPQPHRPSHPAVVRVLRLSPQTLADSLNSLPLESKQACGAGNEDAPKIGRAHV